jgi:hypothetical protein
MISAFTELAQSPMGPRFIVIGGKLAKDPAQMGLAEHNQVVETFPSDRADRAVPLKFCLSKSLRCEPLRAATTAVTLSRTVQGF